MVATRPDVAMAVGALRHFLGSLVQKDWQAVKRVLRYLQAALMHGLDFSLNGITTLQRYSDTD